ncbi:hypothetical protein T4D_16995 [Trichinella pseudospiralis]|uniref:Uncharacterized protein n=1 Tax=Trichinella pseudospiralis TaxID=6337 RepID=A0A0V1FW57_TRIPS|nr:hypothetical protein T4D_16995 [Trichinella pseudospiralis]
MLIRIVSFKAVLRAINTNKSFSVCLLVHLFCCLLCYAAANRYQQTRAMKYKRRNLKSLNLHTITHYSREEDATDKALTFQSTKTEQT